MVTPVDLRCPRCGTRLTAFTPYPWMTSYTRCPHCASVLPFVAPREPPPLYSWEVYPGLYPPTPVPTPPSRWRRPALVALLLAVTMLLVGLGGIFALLGSVALQPGTQTVGGTIAPASTAVPWVQIQGENGFAVNLTVPSGAFSVTGVPYGGVQIRAGADGYAILEVELFLSPVYASISGSPTQLQLSLSPANGTSLNIVDTTSFPDLESFAAGAWSGTGLLWVSALVTSLGALGARRDKAPLVIVGGATAIAAPFVLPLLGIDVINEALTAVALSSFGVGVIVLLIVLPEFARAQRPVEPI